MKTLRKTREDCGVSVASLAHKLGIPEDKYDEMERRPDQISIDTAKAIAKHLGVKLDDIFFLSAE